MTSLNNLSIISQLRSKFGSRINISKDCDLASDIVVEIAETGFIQLGERVSIRRGTTLQASRGAKIIIEDDVAIGENVFISAMVGIRIGKGCGISNMVDIHDHNHRDRSEIYLPGRDLTPWGSGFEAAPIIIESGTIISNKVSITAGVRIGQNTKVGANSVVSRTLGSNLVAVGSPAKPTRKFNGILTQIDQRVELVIAFFGTSIMQHFEAYAPSLYNQADLPPIGSQVTVESWVNRGYIHRVYLSLQALWPDITLKIENFGIGGATSRNILEKVKSELGDQKKGFDIAFVSCGINDVWRKFQGRLAEAVDIEEYQQNYAQMLTLLNARSRKLICLSETPFGLPDSEDMNMELSKFNEVAKISALKIRAEYLDLWESFVISAKELAAWNSRGDRISLWSDGVHLSELGDALINEIVMNYMRETDLLGEMQTYPRYERNEALSRYKNFFL